MSHLVLCICSLPHTRPTTYLYYWQKYAVQAPQIKVAVCVQFPRCGQVVKSLSKGGSDVVHKFPRRLNALILFGITAPNATAAAVGIHEQLDAPVFRTIIYTQLQGQTLLICNMHPTTKALQGSNLFVVCNSGVVQSKA